MVVWFKLNSPVIYLLVPVDGRINTKIGSKSLTRISYVCVCLDRRLMNPSIHGDVLLVRIICLYIKYYYVFWFTFSN